MAKTRTVSVLEEAVKIPGAKVVTVPDSWFAALDARSSVSVWDALYTWLMREYGIADPYRQMHTRTRVGRELMEKLLAAERARIARRNPKMSAAEIKKAVAWSNVDAGPMETAHLTASARLAGDALYVTPAEDPRGTGETTSKPA
jgi:hypothetical protein